jgi:ABC-type lipoprotein release transport system permease subunit
VIRRRDVQISPFSRDHQQASTLVMMGTFDVAAFSAGIVIVIAACLVAVFYPARRAAGVEPFVALRIE